jgi:hypothetical protein
MVPDFFQWDYEVCAILFHCECFFICSLQSLLVSRGRQTQDKKDEKDAQIDAQKEDDIKGDSVMPVAPTRPIFLRVS